MHYTQLFRRLREAKGLTLEQLSKMSRRHRNTVVNVESGRPVKFKTIMELMVKMGYPTSSPEMRSMGLLWLEAISGLPFSKEETEAAARKAIATYGVTTRHAGRRLNEAIARSHLTAEQIDLLVFAAHHVEVLAILDSVRDLATSLGQEEMPQLKVAEDEP